MSGNGFCWGRMGLMLSLMCTSGLLRGGEPGSGWTSFRNGGSSAAHGSFPVAWSPEKNVAWQIELPGYGQSSPVVLSGRVFVCSVIGPQKEECCVSCLELGSGKVLWTYRQAAAVTGPSNYSAARSAPTPVVDARAAYCFFEGGDIVALSHTGELLWKRNLAADYGPFLNNHGLGSSPTQTDDLVILNLEHRGPSCLLALQKQTGATAWRAERPSGSSWTSPIVAEINGEQQVIVSSAGSVTAWSPLDGTRLWTVGGLAGNSVPSPAAVDSRLFVGARVPEFGSTQDAAQSNLCLSLGGNPGQAPAVLWRASKSFCDYASPVVNGSYVYYLNNVGVLSCLQTDTGRLEYMERLGTTCWATPVVAGPYTWFFGKDGSTHVVKGGASFERVSVNLLWDPVNPPKPESYREGEGSAYGPPAATENARTGGVADAPSDPAKAPAEGRRGGPATGMLAVLMKADANADGLISEQELPAEFREMLPRVDLNGDKSIDGAEMKSMEESFRKRREGSRESARDPIVYGVAAADGNFVIRTGTRIYCVRTDN